jgi:hypothetical protein
MSNRLRTAGLLLFGIVGAHSVVGEVLLIRPMGKARGLPRLAPWLLVPTPAVPGSEAMARQTLRFGWHLPSILGFAFAQILLRYGSLTELGVQERFVVRSMAISLLLCAAVVFATTRGRHPGWTVLLATALLCWTAAR